MRFSVKRTGGYIGVTEIVANVETEKLAPPAANNLEQLVREIGFFQLPARLPDSEIGADLFRFEITVTDGVRRHSVVFQDADPPQSKPLNKLLAALVQLG